MADLLECLLQIKGLRQTIDRLSALVSQAPPARWTSVQNEARGEDDEQPATPLALLARLAELEVVHGAALRLILSARRPAVPAADERALLALAGRLRWSASEAFAHFAARRLDNLELLDGCTADDLSRIGVHPLRRDMPLDDLVALMLASDVEHIGAIRRALDAAG